MKNTTSRKSISLVALLLLSILTGLITIPAASAVNETKSGIISGTETWTGTMNLDGDVTVAEGAQLIVNAGTTINLPYGAYIDVEGAICIADNSCGASSGSAGNQARFVWSTPTDYTITGRCYSNNSNNPNWNDDTGCGSGMIIRSTIDQAITSIKFAHFENAYGFPFDASQVSGKQYGVLVFDGSSTTATGLSFKDINTSNILALDLASPTITDSTFTLGIDGSGYDAAAIRAYGAGAGILATMKVRDSVFTGTTEPSCDDGRSMIHIESSYIDFSRLDINENAQGVYLKQSSGSLTDSTLIVKCNGIDTNSHKVTGAINHTLYLSDNIITTVEGAGITAYDGAIVEATGNTISGADKGSGFGIRDSVVIANNNVIGPITGYNGLWIYGTSDVSAENNTIQDTGAEAVLIGEYHFGDSSWQGIPRPTAARLFFANNQISNNTGVCNSQLYGGEFACPAIHVFMSSATLYDNTVTNNGGDGMRIKGGIVNAQRNTIEVTGFAVNISHYDDNAGSKYGSIAYFSGNTYTNASQVYNITESRVIVQSEFIPDAGGNELYPVQLSWLSPECPLILAECLLVPSTSLMPPAFMPMALEVIENSTVFSYADLQNFDSSKIHVQNQNSAWGSQVREGELVRYQVKAKNSNVVDATVIIRDATGLPLYTLTTDAFGFTPEVSLPSDFLLDRDWNHLVGELNVRVQDDNTIPAVWLDENSCADGYDNDGDTKVDSEDTDCTNGRELPFYFVEAYMFGKGQKEFDFVLSGSIDDVINLDNLKPSVTVTQNDGFSFATTVTLTGTSWDGISGPYGNSDFVAYQNQFGIINRVEVKPPGSSDWYSAIDVSGAAGMITKSNHPFKTWNFDWEMSAHPEGEGDVTFRVRSYDGLDYSPVEVRKYKLNLVAPSILVNTPNDGTFHDNAKVTFTGTASDPYSGTWGSDINSIWFDINGPNDYTANFDIPGSTAWAYDWMFQELQTGDYTFRIWASDSDFCNLKSSWMDCAYESRTISVNTENAIPFVTVNSPVLNDILRANETQLIEGWAFDNDGLVTRVEITIYDLASGAKINNGPDPVTTFAPNGGWETTWDTSNLIHDQQYELFIKSWDGKSYSVESSIRITIDNPSDADNLIPEFNYSNWVSTITLFCDSNTQKQDRCNSGISIDLTDHFSDPDGPVSSSTNGLTFDVYDDPGNFEDDDYVNYLTFDANGVVKYNPAFVTGLPDDISEWSLIGLMFEARDSYDSVAFSAKVNIIVVEVSFTVTRDGDGPLGPGSPAYFSGQGLPNSVIEARYDSLSGLRLNSTRVNADATWSMEISSNQLAGNEGPRNIIFEMDDQVFRLPGENSEAMFQLSVGDGEASSSNFGWILAIIVGVIILLGAGMFFFQVEYDDLDEEAELMAAEEQVTADPYAWAKARKELVSIPSAQVPTTPAVVQQQVSATPHVAQHPGWIWDAESNNWVPDPNYIPEQ